MYICMNIYTYVCVGIIHICIYKHLYVYTYVYVYIYTYIYIIYICVYIYTSMSIHVYTYIYIHIYCMYKSIPAYIYIDLCTYKYIYTYTTMDTVVTNICSYICDGYIYIYACTIEFRTAMPLGAEGQKPQSPWPTSSSVPLQARTAVCSPAAPRGKLRKHIATGISRCAPACRTNTRPCHWVPMGGSHSRHGPPVAPARHRRALQSATQRHTVAGRANCLHENVVSQFKLITLRSHTFMTWALSWVHLSSWTQRCSLRD